jgi:hypothetical protein
LPNLIAHIYAHVLVQPNKLSKLEENALFFKIFEKSTKKVIVRKWFMYVKKPVNDIRNEEKLTSPVSGFSAH